MENTQVGLRELYDCVFLATIDMEIGSRKVRAGEPVVILDNVQSFGLDERKRRVDAKGGYQNASRVYWENSTKATVHFRQGTFSKTTLSMLGNAAMVEEDRVIDNVQRVELDENKQAELKYEPINIVAYGNQTYYKEDMQIDGNIITIPSAEEYEDITAYYEFNYRDVQTIKVGRQLIKGYLRMTAKTKMKDEETGVVKTAIVSIPKLKLMSDFSILLGDANAPAKGNFTVEAIPVGSKGDEFTVEFIMLNDDLSSEI